MITISEDVTIKCDGNKILLEKGDMIQLHESREDLVRLQNLLPEIDMESIVVTPMYTIDDDISVVAGGNRFMFEKGDIISINEATAVTDDQIAELDELLKQMKIIPQSRKKLLAVAKENPREFSRLTRKAKRYLEATEPDAAEPEPEAEADVEPKAEEMPSEAPGDDWDLTLVKDYDEVRDEAVVTYAKSPIYTKSLNGAERLKSIIEKALLTNKVQPPAIDIVRVEMRGGGPQRFVLVYEMEPDSVQEYMTQGAVGAMVGRRETA